MGARRLGARVCALGLLALGGLVGMACATGTTTDGDGPLGEDDGFAASGGFGGATSSSGDGGATQASTSAGMMDNTICGNDSCEVGETPMSCPEDCAGGSSGETTSSSSASSGGGASTTAASSGATTSSTGGGGPICGNFQCEVGETPQNCPNDCGGGTSGATSGSSSSSTGGGATCAHAPCIDGAKLDANCDPCVSLICTQIDPYCCNNQWDAGCALFGSVYCVGVMGC